MGKDSKKEKTPSKKKETLTKAITKATAATKAAEANKRKQKKETSRKQTSTSVKKGTATTSKKKAATTSKKKAATTSQTIGPIPEKSDYQNNVEIQLLEMLAKKSTDNKYRANVSFNCILPDNVGGPSIQTIELGPNGTFIDYCSDVHHDSTGIRTSSEWTPIQTLSETLGINDPHLDEDECLERAKKWMRHLKSERLIIESNSTTTFFERDSRNIFLQQIKDALEKATSCPGPKAPASLDPKEVFTRSHPKLAMQQYEKEKKKYLENMKLWKKNKDIEKPIEPEKPESVSPDLTMSQMYQNENEQTSSIGSEISMFSNVSRTPGSRSFISPVKNSCASIINSQMEIAESLFNMGKIEESEAKEKEAEDITKSSILRPVKLTNATLDHGVEEASVVIGTGASKNCTLGDCYDNGRVIVKRTKKNSLEYEAEVAKLFPNNSDEFNKIGCAVIMKIQLSNGRTQSCILYTIGNWTNNSISCRGCLIFIDERGDLHRFQFDNSNPNTFLSTHINHIDEKTFYRGEDMENVPIYFKAIIKYMADRSYIAPVLYSNLIGQPMCLATHDRPLASAIMCMKNDKNPILIPIVHTHAGGVVPNKTYDISDTEDMKEEDSKKKKGVRSHKFLVILPLVIDSFVPTFAEHLDLTDEKLTSLPLTKENLRVNELNETISREQILRENKAAVVQDIKNPDRVLKRSLVKKLSPPIPALTEANLANLEVVSQKSKKRSLVNSLTPIPALTEANLEVVSQKGKKRSLDKKSSTSSTSSTSSKSLVDYLADSNSKKTKKNRSDKKSSTLNPSELEFNPLDSSIQPVTPQQSSTLDSSSSGEPVFTEEEFIYLCYQSSINIKEFKNCINNGLTLKLVTKERRDELLAPIALQNIEEGILSRNPGQRPIIQINNSRSGSPEDLMNECIQWSTSVENFDNCIKNLLQRGQITGEDFIRIATPEWTDSAHNYILSRYPFKGTGNKKKRTTRKRTTRKRTTRKRTIKKRKFKSKIKQMTKRKDKGKGKKIYYTLK